MEQTIPTHHETTAPLSRIEQKSEPSLDRLRHGALDQLERAKTYVREHPREVAIGSLVAGFILARLPLLPIAVGLSRLLLTLARPALILLGAQKLYEEFRHSR